MATVKNVFQVSGSIGEYTIYTRKGTDKAIMRLKGGPNGDKMANSPTFKEVRKHQTEFSGCTKFAAKTRIAFGDLFKLANYNLNSKLTGIGKTLMKLDETTEAGKRSLKLSQYKQILEGFNFNNTPGFSSMLLAIPRWELDRENLQAVVYIPEINTDIDVNNIHNLPFFRLIIAIGTVSDSVYNPKTENYEPMVVELNGASVTVTGEWNSSHTILPKSTMSVQMHESRRELLTENVTVLLSMGVEFANTGFDSKPVAVKYSGSGKVIAVS